MRSVLVSLWSFCEANLSMRNYGGYEQVYDSAV